MKDKILLLAKQQGAQVTPLREQVLDIVLKIDGIIKAYHVLAQMQLSSQTVIAPPTAYRALDFWTELGILHKIPAVNGYILCRHLQQDDSSYNQNNNTYTHNNSFILVCTQCGTVDEQSLTKEWQALAKATNKKGFKLQEEYVFLAGICAKCHQQNEKSS